MKECFEAWWRIAAAIELELRRLLEREVEFSESQARHAAQRGELRVRRLRGGKRNRVLVDTSEVQRFAVECAGNMSAWSGRRAGREERFGSEGGSERVNRPPPRVSE